MRRGFAVGFGGASFSGVHIYRLSSQDDKLIFEREIIVDP